MELFGGNSTEFVEMYNRAIEMLREWMRSLKELFEGLAALFKEVCTPIQSSHQPRAGDCAAYSLMRTIFLFKRHPAATMRVHVAATGDEVRATLSAAE